MNNELPMPAFFEPDKAEEIRMVNYQELAVNAREWANIHNVEPAAKDKTKICLVPIDCQITFCHPEGELSVAGAIDDCIRTSEFIYRNLGVITQIAPTLDTHISMQIFHEIYLVDEDGNHPAPSTIVTEDDIKSGKWKVNHGIANALRRGDYLWLQNHLKHYTESLKQSDKQALIVWPYHAMLMGIGHAVVPIIEEAIRFHGFARNSEPDIQIKGGNPFTENYSVLSPEVLDGPKGEPIAQKNARFINTLLNYDMVILLGQAKSHCVAWTIDNLLNEINAKDPDLAKKVYLPEDCTSPVVIPGVIDFTDTANAAFDKFRDAGMHVVKSTDPIADWPDSPLA